VKSKLNSECRLNRTKILRKYVFATKQSRARISADRTIPTAMLTAQLTAGWPTWLNLVETRQPSGGLIRPCLSHVYTIQYPRRIGLQFCARSFTNLVLLQCI